MHSVPPHSSQTHTPRQPNCMITPSAPAVPNPPKTHHPAVNALGAGPGRWWLYPTNLHSAVKCGGGERRLRPAMHLPCEDAIPQFIIRASSLVSRIICARPWGCCSTKLLEKGPPEGLLIWVVMKEAWSERLVWAPECVR